MDDALAAVVILIAAATVLSLGALLFYAAIVVGAVVLILRSLAYVWYYWIKRKAPWTLDDERKAENSNPSA